MGRRILFVSNSGWGRVNPLITIAGELTARGVGDIWFTSTDGHKAAIEAIPGGEPVSFASLGPVIPEKEPENWPDAAVRAMTTRSTLRNIKAVWDISADFDHRRRQYLRTCEVIDEARPALAVVDLFSHSAIDAISTKGVPYLAVCPATPSQVYTERLPRNYPTPLSGLPRDLSPRQRAYNAAFRLAYQAMGWDPRRLRANVQFFRDRQAEGLANPASTISKYADDALAVLSYFVFGYEYPFPNAPGNLKMLGAIIPRDTGAEDADHDLDQWLDSHESIVYTAFGTIMRLNPRQIQAILDAVARLGPEHHVLWKLPRSRQHLLPDNLPPNLRVESWVPSQLATLAHPHVRASFNHGGDNSVQESLYFGKPQLVMPFWMDNADNAARLVDSGAGLAVAHHRDPDGRDIAARLARLLGEPQFRSRAQYWSQRLHEAGGVGAASGSELLLDLRVDPGVRPFETLGEPSFRCPAETAGNLGVVAASAAHPLWRVQFVLAFDPDPGDFFENFDDFVDAHQLVAAEVDRPWIVTSRD
jgi:polyene glycosyltransferase